MAAVSTDMGLAYQIAATKHAPQAALCVDPFHVVKAANEGHPQQYKINDNVAVDLCDQIIAFLTTAGT